MAKKKSKKPTKRKVPAPQKEKWVDKLEFVPLAADEDNSSPSFQVRIVSWNILAQAYCTRRSHRHLPPMYQKCVFSPPMRTALLRQTLERFCNLDVDVFCLQEVDMDLNDLLEGYDSVLTPTVKGGGSGGRVDACGIYFSKQNWRLVEHELVRLDDLATLGQSSTHPGIESNLQGLSTSLLRRNVAILCRLQHRRTKHQMVVCNAHVYWNPEYNYVKLCQVVYVCKRAHQFAGADGIIFCGDLNSPPYSHVHEYLTKGVVNAKQVAPWYSHVDNEDCLLEAPCESSLVEQLEQLKISEQEPQIRYLLDFTLNRFTRWLRILGIDAALETDEEEIQRTKRNNIVVFERCRNEKRTLITTSKQLLLRKDCPPGTYLVNTKSLNNLEASLVHLLLHHGVTLEPRNFLSKCVVCNGTIVDVVDLQDKRRVFLSNNAPDLSDELEVYECNGCGQGYWWCDRPTSSASRVKSQATRLFELCLRGGVPIKGPLNMFDFVNVDQEREQGLEDDQIELEYLEVTDWLNDERLSCPIPLESAYALRDEHDNNNIIGESLAFTNVTHDFVGALDYVLFDTRHFRPTRRLYVPTSFKELNGRELYNGHLLPSMDWPSDHLAVGVQLELIASKHDEPTVNIFGVDKSESGNSSSSSSSQVTPTFSSTDESTPPVRATQFCAPVNGGTVPPTKESGSVSSQATPTLSSTDDSTTPADGVVEFCGPVNGGSIPPPPTTHAPKCACGCVPKIPSLFEMAELRKQARLAAKNNAI
jgi:mRNA deadenylase 3'-5' endonuclease subunit Ccr4/uncharacterized protein with PIN domain